MRFKKSSSIKISSPVAEVAMPAFSFNALTLCLISLGMTFGGSAQAETWSFTSNRTEDIGDQRREIDGLGVGNNITGTVIGAGGTLVYNGTSNLAIGGNASNTTATLDMSGLSHFVFDNAAGTMVISGRRTGGAANATDQSHGIITLAGETNTITASVLGLGSTSRSVNGPGINTGVLNMGQQNIFNVDTLMLGTNQGTGTLTFDSAVTGGSLKLRASNGVDAVGNISIGTGVTSNYSGSSGLLDTTSGTLDAKVDTLAITSSTYGTQAARGAFNMGAGLLEVDKILLGQSNRTSGAGSTVANLTLSNGGVIKANAITMGDIISGPGDMLARIYIESGATLRANTILAGNGSAIRQIIIRKGILANLSADADMRSDIDLQLEGGNTTFLTEGAGSIMTLSGEISGIAKVIKTGDGVLALTGNNSWTFGTDVEQGTLSFATGANLGRGAVNLNGGKLLWQTGNTTDISNRLTIGSNGGIIDDNGNDLTFNSGIAGDGALVKQGSGTLTLTADNTRTGGTVIDNGAIQIGNGGTAGSLLGDIVNNSQLILNRSDVLALTNNVSGRGSLVQRGSGNTVITGDIAQAGGTQIDVGSLQIGDGGTSGSLLGNIVNNSQLILNRSDVLALTNNVAGSGSLIQRGSGTSVITGDVAHAGGTQIEAGNLQVGDGGTRGNLSGNVQIANGSALLVNRVDATLLNGVISGDGRFEQQGSGTAVLSADNSWTGGTTISNGTLQIGNAGTSGSVVGDILNEGTLQFNRSDDVVLTNLVTGSGDLVQAGSGLLTLNGDQVYTGTTRVNNGTLQINGSVQSASIGAAGTLTGEATIFGSLTNAGTLRPGAIGATDYGTITVVGDYIGNNGVLAINSWLGGDDSPSDQLILDGGHASGITRVAVTNTNSEIEHSEADGIKVIDAINGATTEQNAFRLAGDTRSGALSYRLFRGSIDGAESDSWYLRSQFIVDPIIPDPVDPVEPEPTDPVDPIEPDEPVEPGPIDPIDPTEPGDGGDIEEPTNPARPGTELPLTPPPAVLPPGEYPVIGPAIATYGVVQPIARELGMLTLGTRDQRSGDAALMVNSGTAQGPAMWTRLLASEIDHAYQAFAAPAAKGTLGGLQIGADVWQGSLFEGHSERFGLYVAQTRANIAVSGLVTNEAGTQYERQNTGKVKLTGTSLGGYWTHFGPGNSYLDTTLQGTRYRGSAASESGSMDVTGYGVVASLETGYPFGLSAFGPGFTLEPQAQLIWQETRFKDSADRQSSVALGKTTGTTGRVGLRAKWSLETASGAVVEPFASVNYWQDWNGRATTVYDGKDRAPLASSTGRISTEVGVSTGLTTNLKVHGALGYQTGASSSSLEKRDSYSAGLGLRYAF